MSNINLDEIRNEFKTWCGVIHRTGFDDMLAWLDKTDWYVAPASSKYHLAVPGGLLTHSLNVHAQMTNTCEAYHIDASPESIAISALFHDLCKVNMYKQTTRNVKNAEGRWEQVPAYEKDEKFTYGGHGSKSVFLIERFMKLEPEEAIAINCHMSCWNGDMNVGKVYERHPFAWALHVADEAATYMMETR